MPTGVERVAELELARLVGEIHADVKTLMEREKSNSARLTSLEHRTLLGGFVLAALMSMRDPGGLLKMLAGVFGA